MEEEKPMAAKSGVVLWRMWMKLAWDKEDICRRGEGCFGNFECEI